VAGVISILLALVVKKKTSWIFVDESD